MLLSLSVKNYKLIKNAHIEFDEGFNAITGETGSGKSMFLSSLLLLPQSRATKDVIRKGEDSCSVTAVFDTASLSENVCNILKDMGVESEDTLIISRTIKDDSRGRLLINGTPVPSKTVRDILTELISFSLQRDQNSLLLPGTATSLIDAYASTEEMAKECSLLIKKCKEKLEYLEEIKKDVSEIKKERDYLESVYREIKNAKLKVGEDDEIKTALSSAKHSLFYKNATTNAINLLSENDINVLSSIREALHELNKADEKGGEGLFKGITTTLEEAYGNITASLDELEKRNKTFNLSEADLDALNERDSLISRLKRKYGENISDILSRMDDAKQKLDMVDDSEHLLKEAENDYKKYESELVSLKEQLYKKRIAKFSEFSKSIEEKLENLEMASSRFEVSIKQGSIFEKDEIKFMFSPNKGEDLADVSEVSSGGELSRLYLAILSTLPNMNNKITIVFDEIDTGLGGKTGSKVRDYLTSLKNKAQIIAVTHQGIVAPGADEHIKVEKREENGRSIVVLKHIIGEERVREIARLMAGDESETESLELARSLLNKK